MQPDPGEEYKAVMQCSRSHICIPLIKFKTPFMRLKLGMRLVIMREHTPSIRRISNGFPSP
jgi:hypothetical protein